MTDGLDASVLESIRGRGITRLCHYTSWRNLRSIEHLAGLWAVNELSRNGVSFARTDGLRLDRLPRFISCSVQVPNACILSKLSADHVILTLEPRNAARLENRFSRHNAAKFYGGQVRHGTSGWDSLFTNGLGPFEQRSGSHLASCPTDLQAEVLVKRHIALEDIRSVIVRSEEAFVRLRPLVLPFSQRNRLTVAAAPAMFDQSWLSDCVRSGLPPPTRTLWEPA